MKVPTEITSPVAMAVLSRRTLGKTTLGVAGLALWTVASTLGSAAAAPPVHRAATASPSPSETRATSHFHGDSHRHISSLPAANHSCKCTGCGKKQKTWARAILDGVTAGTDRLIFGSSYQDSCECDDSGSACDAMPIELMPMPQSDRFHRTDDAQPPRADAPGMEFLPVPIHHAPVRDPRSNSAPAAPLPKHPTAAPRADQMLDPFGDDPVYQGTNPAISRSSYYE